MKEICKDLADEGDVLDAVIAHLDESAWDTITPFHGWSVRDEISHLAYFDRLAKISATNPEAFAKELEALAKAPESFFEITLREGQAMGSTDLLEWWRKERAAMLDAFLKLDAKTRVPWYLPMSAKSSASARLMETWAHGQDIIDALGVHRYPTHRLRHIAHLGFATFAWSFSVRKMEIPDVPVYVEITGPEGDVWCFGDADASDTIKGPAEDFCLVVIQRRHYQDTELTIHGDTAREWMSIAQVFAGPPSSGPPPAGTKKHH
jgi:uncharacterized protein (TIGR03084 family)